MKASIPFEFTDAQRQAIARFLGYHRPATHIECVAWARLHLLGSLSLMAQAPARPVPPENRVVREGDPVTR